MVSYGEVMKRALFRCDASPDIGGGHVMRCLTLADELSHNRWDCVFACNDGARSIIPVLQNYKLIPTENLDKKTDLLVVDHYRLDHIFESKSRSWADKILVIDDLADREHDCDILLDQTFRRNEHDYKSLVPNHCTILTGSKYALLRPQFSETRKESLERRNKQNFKLQRVFISLGMTNIFNITLKALCGLELYTDTPLQIDVILGKSASFIDNVKDQIDKMNNCGFHNVKLHSNVENMAGLMMKADLAIGAGGTTSWERCCLGVPAIVIELADNQKKITDELDSAGAIINMGWHEYVSAKDLAGTLLNLSNNSDTMIKISRKVAGICDGYGVKRVTAEIENVCN